MVWMRKKRLWIKGFNVVTPSLWLESCVRKSSLMSTWRVETISNPINVDVWKGRDKLSSKKGLGVPLGVPVILFGAIGGLEDKRKGFDILIEALRLLEEQGLRVHVISFGSDFHQIRRSSSGNMTHLGNLLNDEALRIAYSAADVFAIPSRQDNLPNSGVEAIACGTPVVSFDIGGMSDIVDHLSTGFLADPYDTADFARGIRWALDQKNREAVRTAARSKAEAEFSYPLIGGKYQALYESILG
jgi:glycosyltransferase involved in cell wall biosynthesis